ncbi:MAG: BamA/TamA family outer membrane protein [Candidatus Binatia bacterium]
MVAGRAILAAALFSFAIVVPAGARAAEVEAPLERSWWREALELPENAVDVFAWPVKRGLIWAERVNLPERVLDTLYFNDERTAGWFPNASFGGEIQSALGVRVFHDDLWGGGEEIGLSTLLAIGDLEESRINFRFYAPTLGGRAAYLLTDVLYSEDNDEDLFVRIAPDGAPRLGPRTRESDDTTYELDLVRTRFEGGVRPIGPVKLGFSFEPLFGDVEEGGGAELPIPATVDGFGGPAVLLGGVSLVEWDARDSTVRPRAGWYARAEAGSWTGARGRTTDGRDYRYLRHRIDLRRYQPTFRHDRVVVIRVWLDRVETYDGGAVPFWDLPVLDEDHALRGFDRNRFRDKGALLFNVEYRYPIWDTWDGFVFLDEGQVFRHYSDARLEGFEWSAGGGVLFLTEKSFLLRVQYATSEEDRSFRVVLEQAF